MAEKHGNLSINSDNLFPIIKKWLYSDHDIFFRELISNGCDAITKLKKLALMGEYETPDDETYKVQVTVNPKEKTIRIEDNGLGMTEDEVDEYINQIAFSGAQDFLNKYKDKANEDQVQDAEKEKAESPIQVVLQLKQNAVLGMTIPDMSSVSSNAVELKDTVSKRQCETGTYHAKKTEKLNVFDRVMVLEYIEKYFSSYTEPGKGDLAYEMEYILCGKETDRQNLESSVERLMLMREAANVAHIIADREKLNQTLIIATSLAGFSGNPVIVKIVQIGVVAAWAYVESILDLRTLLSGGKIALMKSSSEWNVDIKKIGELVTDGGKAKECKDGLNYQGYVKQLLFAVKEKKIAYRMMDIMEFAIQKEENSKNARMDHMIGNMTCEMRFEAEPLFAKSNSHGGQKLGRYTFVKHQKMSYSNE